MIHEVSVAKVKEDGQSNPIIKKMDKQNKRSKQNSSQTKQNQQRSKEDMDRIREKIVSLNYRYDTIVDEYPGLAFKTKPKINSENDLSDYEAAVESIEIQANYHRTLDNMEDTWKFLTSSGSKAASYISLSIVKNPRLAAKQIIFGQLLSENYSMYKPTLIQLIRKYPSLQIGQIPPELKLMTDMYSLWNSIDSDAAIQQYVNKNIKRDSEYDDL